MAAKKRSKAMEFIIASLTSDRAAQYKDIAAAAAKKKLKVFPIMFGRGQTLLGIVKQSPHGEGKRARAKAAAAAARAGSGKRGPGRPRKGSGGAFDGSLDGIITAVKSTEQAKARYVAALARIQAILTGALS